MMQMSILPPPLIKAPQLGSFDKRHPSIEEHESPYMEMANGKEYVNLPAEDEPSENRLGSEDGDYLTVEQLHMPSDNLQVRMKAEQRKKLSPLNGRSETATRAPNRLCLDKSMSTSITELLLNTDTGAEAFWHSAPSLEKPPPIAARRQTTRVATSSSPSVLPRLIPPRILPRNAHRNV